MEHSIGHTDNAILPVIRWHFNPVHFKLQYVSVDIRARLERVSSSIRHFRKASVLLPSLMWGKLLAKPSRLFTFNSVCSITTSLHSYFLPFHVILHLVVIIPARSPALFVLHKFVAPA